MFTDMAITRHNVLPTNLGPLPIWAMVILILLSTCYNLTTPTSPCLQLFQQHHQNIVKLIETGTYEVAEAIRT